MEDTPPDLPPLSAEQVLIAATTQALVSALGPKKGEYVVRFMADRLASPGESQAEREARALFRRQLPTLIDLLAGRRRK